MLLAIDIGNTNTVLGVFDDDRLERSWRIKTDARHTADELALTFRGLLADHKITGTAACSTVPAALRELRTMLANYYPDVPTVLVEPGIRTGVSLKYENPKEVGADRIVNTLAAHHLVDGQPAIVVDFGTTTSSAARSRPGSRSAWTRSPPAPRSCARSSSSRRADRLARAPSRRCSPASSTASPARWTDSSGDCPRRCTRRTRRPSR
jgi:hypothetical protein